MLYVFLGGGFGSLLRYFLSLHLPKGAEGGAFPYATFSANLLGSLLIGLLAGYLMRHREAETIRLLLVSGFCGGFTTFSTFSSETLTLLRQGFPGVALLYAGLSLLSALLLTFAGYKIFAP